MSYRELWVLVQYLPQESWTQTVLRDQQLTELINPATVGDRAEQRFGPWALINYQLATLTDAVNDNTYVVAVAGRLKDPKAPAPVPRPGLDRPVRRQSEAAVLYLKKLRARGVSSER